jgi:hypothetical protein
MLMNQMDKKVKIMLILLRCSYEYRVFEVACKTEVTTVPDSSQPPISIRCTQNKCIHKDVQCLQSALEKVVIVNRQYGRQRT